MTNPTTVLNKIPVDPSLKDLLDQYKKQIFLSFNCHALATIQSFDPGDDRNAPTVTATINYKQTFYNINVQGQYVPQLVDYPPITDMPVIILGGGPGTLTMPIAQGDECMVLFNDVDMDNWFQSGLPGGVATNRMHSFSDGIALIGVHSNLHPITNYDPVRAILRAGTAVLGPNPSNSKILLANVAPIVAGDGSLSYTTTLNTLLQTLITTIENLVSATAAITVTGVSTGGSPSGPPANAATITAIGGDLTAIAIQIGELLE